MRRLKRVAVLATSAWLLLSTSWAVAWTGTVTEIWVSPFSVNQIVVIGTSADADCNYSGNSHYAVFSTDSTTAPQTQESLNRILSVLTVAKTTGSTVTVIAGNCDNAFGAMLK